MQNTRGSVSYTHLDVYKRQAVDSGDTSINEGADIMSTRPFKEVREVIVTESTSPDAVPAWTISEDYL